MLLPVLIQKLERSIVTEVFELEDAVGPFRMDGFNRLIDEFIVCFILFPGLGDTKVKWIVPDLGNVAAEIKRNWKSVFRRETTTQSVQCKLPNSDLMTASAEIAKAKNTGTISTHANVRFIWPSIQDSTNMPEVVAIQI